MISLYNLKHFEDITEEEDKIFDFVEPRLDERILMAYKDRTIIDINRNLINPPYTPEQLDAVAPKIIEKYATTGAIVLTYDEETHEFAIDWEASEELYEREKNNREGE